MKERNIKNGLYGWYEREAMKKIETLPFKQQASCKLIYIAICSLSAKTQNSAEVVTYKFDIARYASLSEKTVQRYLTDLEQVGIIKISPQDRKSNGHFEKVKIWLIQNNPTAGQLGESTEKAQRKLLDTESDVLNKEIKKERNKEEYMCEKDFEIFWEEYPRKTDKKKSIQKFLLLKRESFDLLMRGLRCQKKSKQWLNGYIPHPTTWINGERWNDEVFEKKEDKNVESSLYNSLTEIDE